MAMFTGCVLQKSLIAATSATLSLSGLLLAAGGPVEANGPSMDGADPTAPALLRFAECPHEELPRAAGSPAIDG
ncbi:MAG: hypothetical protein AAGA68_19410 [Pseudomonadota bacterium]